MKIKEAGQEQEQGRYFLLSSITFEFSLPCDMDYIKGVQNSYVREMAVHALMIVIDGDYN